MNGKPETLAYIIIINESQLAKRAITKDEYFSIGRARDNALCLQDDSCVSRRHCAIRSEGPNLIVEDLGSVNGIILNGKFVVKPEKIPLPSCLVVGRTRLAIIPQDASDEDITELIETTFSKEGSILIPSTRMIPKYTEAFLLVDVIGSTLLLKEEESLLPKAVTAMGMMLERDLQKEPHPFLKCTGDGLFACFSTAERALNAAAEFAPALAKRIALPIKLSIALHWGSAFLTAEGDRTGKDVHAAFALESLRRNEASFEAILASPDFRELILMTEDFWFQLKESQRMQASPLGSYILKGLDKKVQIFRWLG